MAGASKVEQLLADLDELLNPQQTERVYPTKPKEPEMAANKRTICLDCRFGELRADQKHAILHLYRWDRKRGWSIPDCRYYVNAVIDHQVAHTATHEI
jgi:hypothetical protein